MKEIQLSTDLNVITAEINSYKQVAGQAIFEIGRRLKHVKENDLAHGEWLKWLELIDFTPRHAQRFMKVYEELPNTTQVSHLGIRALYEIATLPQEEREKKHTLSSGETKTVDEMTVRELEEVKRQLRESEEAKRIILSNSKEAARRVEELNREVDLLKNQPPQVIEKEVIKEVVPEDYDLIKGNYSALESRTKHYKEQNEELRAELKRLENLLNESGMDEQEKDRKRLEIEADINVLELKIKVDRFLKEVAITSFMKGAIAASGKSTKDKLSQSVEMIKDFAKQMDMALEGRIEI